MASLRRILLTTHYLPIIRRSSRLLCLLLLLPVFSWAQQDPSDYPQKFEGDWNVPDFTFQSGEKLADLRLHYITLGSPERDAAGHVRNAVLILHGTADSPADGGVAVTNIQMARDFKAKLRAAGKPVEAVYYEGGRHNDIFASSTQYRDEVQKMVTFLRRHLRE